VQTATTRPKVTARTDGRGVASHVGAADGGEVIGDLAVVRDQPELFGSVASTATVWRAATDHLAVIDGTVNSSSQL
jgi:hypothetical protein